MDLETAIPFNIFVYFYWQPKCPTGLLGRSRQMSRCFWMGLF